MDRGKSNARSIGLRLDTTLIWYFLGIRHLPMVLPCVLDGNADIDGQTASEGIFQ